MKTLFTILLAALCVGSKAQADTTSYWNYSDKINEMTHDHAYYAETSDNTHKVTTTLTVRHEKGKTEALLSVDHAVLNFQPVVFDGMVFNTLTFKAKFDDGKIETWHATPSSDESFDVG